MCENVMCIIIYMKRYTFFLIIDILWRDIKSKKITFTRFFCLFLFKSRIYLCLLSLPISLCPFSLFKYSDSNHSVFSPL